MSTSYISADLRRLVVARAEGLCEYCLIAEVDTYFGCQIDHIISEKHGGRTEAENLAYACAFCNQAKGSDIGSLHWASETFMRFFNPRQDPWHEHFVLAGSWIEALTPIGAVARILGFNADERVLEREALRGVNRYPSIAAWKRISFPPS
jgi:hypothetical protein